MFTKEIIQDMVALSYNPSTQEDEAGGSLWVWSQPGLCETLPGKKKEKKKRRRKKLRRDRAHLGRVWRWGYYLTLVLKDERNGQVKRGGLLTSTVGSLTHLCIWPIKEKMGRVGYLHLRFPGRKVDVNNCFLGLAHSKWKGACLVFCLVLCQLDTS